MSDATQTSDSSGRQPLPPATRRRLQSCFEHGSRSAAKNDFDPQSLKEAMAYGIVIASFNVEDFSLDRLKGIDRGELDLRMERYKKMLSF